jgi:hypothetical protein
MASFVALETSKGRGRPPKLRVVPSQLIGLKPPATAEEWFDLGDRLLLLDKAGHAQPMMGQALGVSQATVSRMIKAAAWPTQIRAKILIHEDRFPLRMLMRLARTTFKDQGRVTSDGRRRVLKSRMTLAAAVDLVIEGKFPFQISEPAEARAKRLEQLVNEERSSRQAQQRKVEHLEAEVRSLQGELSMDKFSAALRRVKELEAEVQRLAHAPGTETVQPPKSENVKRTEEDLSAALSNAKANIIDWSKGLMVISAGNGDVLDGVCDRIKLLSVVRFKHGRPLCSACRSMIG